jgi:hypothetical protein
VPKCLTEHRYQYDQVSPSVGAPVSVSASVNADESSSVEYCTGTTFRTRTLPVQKFSTRNPTRTRSFATRTLPVPVALLPVPYQYP